jgi:hypothetical protein
MESMSASAAVVASKSALVLRLCLHEPLEIRLGDLARASLEIWPVQAWRSGPCKLGDLACASLEIWPVQAWRSGLYKLAAFLLRMLFLVRDLLSLQL